MIKFIDFLGFHLSYHTIIGFFKITLFPVTLKKFRFQKVTENDTSQLKNTHKNRLNFPTIDYCRKTIPMKLFCQYMAIYFNFSPTSSHLHPLQVENCDSNSRRVVDEDDNGKYRLELVNP